jgi:alkylated DNA nucleotide flippase Atl1
LSGAVSPADRVLAASRLLRPGEWTTYGELGAAATGGGNAARLVARLATHHPGFANAHRVLGSGGVVVRGRGGEAAAQRARERLEDEGVPFRGRAADPACRVGWVELRGRLVAWLDSSYRPTA